MSAEQFVYWLQGYMEMANPTELDPREVQIIKDHLNEVFKKVTPNYGQAISFPQLQLNPGSNQPYITYTNTDNTNMPIC